WDSADSATGLRFRLGRTHSSAGSAILADARAAWAKHERFAMDSLRCILKSSALAALAARVVAASIVGPTALIGISHLAGPIAAFTQPDRLLEAEGATDLAEELPAGGDEIVFPERYAEGVMYTTLDRPASQKPSATGLGNAAQYRKFYATAAAIKALRNAEPIPSGAVITVVKYLAKLDPQGNPIKHENG